jgi:hypothetical protein
LRERHIEIQRDKEGEKGTDKGEDKNPSDGSKDDQKIMELIKHG